MAHEGSTGLLFPIKQMKGNVVFLESSKVVVGDTDALIPIMLDPNNQISFKSGHCRVGDQVVVLPTWGRKDNFIAIKGWGAYEVAAESLVIFNKMDWTYDGYPGRCTTYASGYIWKERFYWSTIPPIPNGYPEYFKLRVMRKGLNGHPDTLIANWPQNCSDGTAVYEDDINVAYGNTTPYIAEEYPLAYGADYKHYFYTAFPKRDNICASLIPELGSNYWMDDAFCPSYVEPPEVDELEVTQDVDGNGNILNQVTVDWPEGEASDLVLIRFYKTNNPQYIPYIVPEPLDLAEGIIPGHGDLLYFGLRNMRPITHTGLDINEYYSYTIWNVETRLNEDNDEIYVFNKYTGDGYHPYCYPITESISKTIFIEPTPLQTCVWDWTGWAFTMSANSSEGQQTTVTDVVPYFCMSAVTGKFGFYADNIGGQYAWAKVTKTLEGTISKINLWVGCSGSTTLSSGGVRIFVNGVQKWGKREDEFTVTGSIGWLEATILLDPPLDNPVIVIERYHGRAFVGWFNAYTSSWYTE